MNSPSQMKQIGIGACACACHSDARVNNNVPAAAAMSSSTTTKEDTSCDSNNNACTRPTMTALHQMLQNHDWKGIQDAIEKDASVAMRIDDSLEEDLWFDEARRRKAVLEGFDASFVGDAHDNEGINTYSNSPKEDLKERIPQLQLRYWVGNHQTTNININEVRAKRDILQKRTLLHSLCRMYFPSNEALVVQLTHGDSDGLKNLMGAVRTAQMLVNASHNCSVSFDDDGNEEVVVYVDNNSSGTKDGRKSSSPGDEHSCRCNNCSCYIYQHYCPPVPLPPVPLPPVERQQTGVRGSDNEMIESHNQVTDHESIQSEENSAMIRHTSVLTMTDAVGETPLHSLVGAGSLHGDLVNVFLNACRPLDGLDRSDHDDNGMTRKPTVYDLLISQNFYGCTPVHFLADVKNEEALRLLLEECPLHKSDRVHPTMISDYEGDLPLHFASCNGASPSLLRILTTSLGDLRSTLMRNSKDCLAIDDYIEWYMDSLNDRRSWEISEGEGESGESESESGDDSGGSDASSASSSNGSYIKKELGVPLNGKCDAHDRDPGYLVSCKFGFLSATTNWESELWDPMWVFIQAAATAIQDSVHTDGQQTKEEAQMHDEKSLILSVKPLLPIHAAVIATKYSNFPALALAASILRNGGGNDSEVSSLLLEDDSCGYLPLHWACGDISSLLSSNLGMMVDISQRRGQACTFSGEIPSISQCEALVRWNTKNLPCSMIEYLIHCNPAAARMPTRDKRLPLHLLVEDGNSPVSAHTLSNKKGSDDNGSRRHQWDDIKLLLKEYPEALGTPDANNHLYPFQLAATSSSYIMSQFRTESNFGLVSLENTYRLIMEDPTLICQILDN